MFLSTLLYLSFLVLISLIFVLLLRLLLLILFKNSTYAVDPLIDTLASCKPPDDCLRHQIDTLASCKLPDDFLRDQIEMVEVELRVMRMFVIYVGCWDDADKRRGVGQELSSLAMDLEAAFKEAREDFRVARRKKQTLATPLVELQEKLALFRPRMKAAFECISSIHRFRSHHPLSNFGNWCNFYNSISYPIRHPPKDLDTPTLDTLTLDTLTHMLRSLYGFATCFQGYCPGPERDLLTHFGAVLVRAAHFVYLYLIRAVDEGSSQDVMAIKLPDVMNSLKPSTRNAVEVYLKLLKAVSLLHSGVLTDDMANGFVDFLIPGKISQLNTFRKGLTHLVVFILDIDASDLEPSYAKLLLMDIIVAISELGSFGYSFHKAQAANPRTFSIVQPQTTSHTDPALFWLLGRMELLRVEVFLIELLNQKIHLNCLENSIYSFHGGLNYLQRYHRDASEAKGKVPKSIWLDISHVAREAGSIYRLFHAKSITKERLRNELFKMLEKIKLLKTEIIFDELLNRHANTQIESLDQGLILLRTYLMGPLEENEKLILTQAESVAKDAVCFYYSLLESEIREDGLRKCSHLLPELVKKMNLVCADIQEIYMPIQRLSKSHIPKTEGFGFIDFLLRDLRELLNSEADHVVPVKHQIHVVHELIEFFRSFLKDIEEQYNENQDSKSLIPSIIQVTLDAEYFIDSSVFGDGFRWYHPLWLSDLVEDLRLIKLQATEICKHATGISNHNIPESPKNIISPAKFSKIDEVGVDLTDQKKIIIDKLIRGSSQRDVVSIVGMAGLGKTTLALKVFNDTSVNYHFHIRSWCCVSQAYRKRELLLQILGDITELTDHILEMSDADLEMKLYQCLKRNRYLIVMDDIWSIQAWRDFEKSFPEDNNRSRILITSRLPDVATEIKKDSAPHALRLLFNDESWKLLQKKLFGTKGCPDQLRVVGKQIAGNCKGLPLAVVAISGLLGRTDMTLERWKQVSESICSRIANDPETRCMDILELSYRYLPNYLKPCFLYTGVFLEDKDIPVRKLVWLWRAEGFITDSGLENTDDVAEGYLLDLIGRSLVMASKRRSCGGVKTCRVHDMLRTLCMRKSEEENFLQCQKGYDELFASSHDDIDYGVDPSYIYPTNSMKYQKRRLSIYSKRNHFVMSRPSGPHVHSLLYSATSDMYPRCPYEISFIFDSFKLLRILDLECINMGNSFPTSIHLLARLRFLALCGDIDRIPASIIHLRDLETLVVKGLKGKVLLPYTLWSMENLRHVHVNNYAAITLQGGKSITLPQVLNLVSLSSPYLLCSKVTENITRRLVKLRKLRCVFSEFRDDTGKCNQFPVLNFLTKLESLNVLYSGRIALPCKFDFPLNLKKLTLSKFRLPWDCISEIGRLPNLKVLKLLSRAFEGKVWEMNEGEFLKLEFLKLDSLNIAQWNASSVHLPQLQHLILRSCRQLEEVPFGFCDSSKLETIELQFCTRSVEESVRRLEEEQLEMGYELKVLIDHSDMYS